MNRSNFCFAALRDFFAFLRGQIKPATNKIAEVTDTNCVSTDLPGVSASMYTEQTPEAWTPPPSGQREVFVAWDALGDGRLIGVFTEEAQVKEIMKINPFYYRYYKCLTGEPTPLALHWLDEEGKAKLLKVCKNLRPAPNPGTLT